MNGRSRRNEIAIQVKIPWTNEETKLSGKQSKKPEFAHSTGEVGEFEPEEAPAEERGKSKTLIGDTPGMSTKQIFMEEVSTKQRRIASIAGHY